MEKLKKLLFITDQQEYSETGTISTLFDIYLQKYFEVHIVYLTNFKEGFSKRDNHYIVPTHERKNIVEYLENHDVNISSFSFLFVRNKKDALENVLKYKSKYNYKVVFRISYPKKRHKLSLMNSYSPIEFIKKYFYKKKIKDRNDLINKCDLFLVASLQVQEVFHQDIYIDTYPIFVGLDPDKLIKHQKTSNEIKKFIYTGTIDEVREFDVILDAFLNLKSSNWRLTVSTTDKAFVSKMVNKYPRLKNNVNIISAMSIKELREQINTHDIGIALLPRNDFYDTVVADKVIDYYTCSIPALMTSNTKNHSIFNDDEGLFCDFESSKITKELELLINTSNNTLGIIGNNGQEKLLKIKRNYKIQAEKLAKKLNEVLQKD
ncbi:MAG TPA: glycosyltransferase [Arcobacter sp.]|nr:glycosyltransferase [Arcobacter sp.]